MSPQLPSETIKTDGETAGSRAAAEIQRILDEKFHLPPDTPASLLCVDLVAPPPHNTRSELRTSLATAGAAAAECLGAYEHQAVSLIVSAGSLRVSITRRPEGYLVSAN